MVFTKEKLTAAVDISDGFAKIVAISGDKGENSLRILDSVQLPTDKEKEVAREVRSLIAKNRLGKSLILASFPRHLVTVRNVRFPTTDEEEVKNMAELQAIKYLPYSQEQIVVSHKVIDVTKDGYTDVMLIVAQRKSVERFIEIFNQAGISIQRLALSSEGNLSWSSMANISDARPVAVIDFNRYHTHIQIIKNGKILFSRSVSFDTTDPDTDKNVVLREIRLSFDSYLKERDEAVSRVILTGREDYSTSFSSFLSDNLSIPCERVRQLQNVKFKETVVKALSLFKDDSYTHLLGIASMPQKLSVNLLPRDIIDKKKEHVIKNELIKTVILLLSVLVAAFGIMEKKVAEKRAYLKRIETRLRKIDPEVEKLLRLKGNVELIQDQLSLRGSSIDIIREVYEILPEDVSLTLFEFEDKSRILLRGATKELSRVFSLLPLLEKSPYFENVKINYATKRTFKQTEFADFEIICALKKVTAYVE